MRILISHVNYPAQFRRLVPAWVDKGHDVIFIARQKEWHSQEPIGFTVIPYRRERDGSGPLVHPYLTRLENAILDGQAVYRVASELRLSNWYPDCVISHVGFGNGLFLKDCFPNAKRIGLVEWFYNSRNSDVDYLPPHAISEDHQLRLRVWNAECLLECSSLDEIVVPSIWQRNQFPAFMREHLNVIHEGIDINLLNSLSSSPKVYLDCLPDNPDIEILTYVSRCFEEYRGFPQAILTISKLQQLRPNLHVLIVGEDGTAYGNPRADGVPWSVWAIDNVPLDPSRTHWLGALQEDQYHHVLSLSDVHLYLTVPFVLSWSLLEAMAAGCSIVASATAPVLEVLDDGISALLVDFFSVQSQVDAIQRLLTDRQLALSLAISARNRSSIYSFDTGLKAWDALLDP